MEIKVEDYQKMINLCYDTENKEFYYLVDDDWEILSDDKFDEIINDYIKSRT